jgi:hypothetical protein
MRFIALWRPTEEPIGEPSPEEMAAMNELIAELTKEGVLLAVEGLASSATGAIVRQTNGTITVTDGPFTETKELVAGFAICNVKSKEHMIELQKRFIKVLGGDGVAEIRQMHEG